MESSSSEDSEEEKIDFSSPSTTTAMKQQQVPQLDPTILDDVPSIIQDDSLFVDSDAKTAIKDDILPEIEEEEDDSFNEDDNQQFRIFSEDTDTDLLQNTSSSML